MIRSTIVIIKWLGEQIVLRVKYLEITYHEVLKSSVRTTAPLEFKSLAFFFTDGGNTVTNRSSIFRKKPTATNCLIMPKKLSNYEIAIILTKLAARAAMICIETIIMFIVRPRMFYLCFLDLFKKVSIFVARFTSFIISFCKRRASTIRMGVRKVSTGWNSFNFL